MLVLASVTDSLVTFAVNLIGDLGLAGVFVLMLLESACIPIPSEATMLFAGFNASTGHYALWLVILVGSVANLVGSWIAYAVGYYGRLELVERHGRFLHIRPADLARAERWFARWGAWAVLASRMLPIVRTFISLPAGVARMPFWRFSVLTFLGSVPWVAMLAIAGDQLGANWRSWKDAFHYVDYVAAVCIVLAVLWAVVRWRRGRARRAAIDVDMDVAG